MKVLAIVLPVVLVVAACSPVPTATIGPSVAPATANPTARPVASVPTPADSGLALPAGFDRIPWAHVDRASRTVTIGVLGRFATTTRTTSDPDSVHAVGTAIVLDTDEGVDIVDAASGRTVGSYHRSDLTFAKPEQSLRNYARQRLEIDVEHGYLYQLDSSADGQLLRRFALDGSHAVVLARLAPDPDAELWDFVDFVLAPGGEVDAVACPPTDAHVTDQRCRLYRIPVGATPPLKPTFLPSKTPRPCFLIAATEHFLIGSSYVGCHADGGYPAQIPYESIDLRTLGATVIDADSDLFVYGAQEVSGIEDGPPVVAELVGNVSDGRLVTTAFPEVGATLDIYGGAIRALSEFRTSGQLQGWVSAIRGFGPGWMVLQSYGPDFAACYLVGASQQCPAGPVYLIGPPESPVDGFQLPPGTYGEILPPVRSPYA